MQTKKILLILGITFSSVLIVSNIWATRAPEFSGYWYTASQQTSPDVYRNACNETIDAKYDLANVTTSANESAILAAEKVMFDYFEVYPTSCQIYSSSPMRAIPPSTFPDKNLWNFTANQPENPVVLDIIVECRIPPDNDFYKAYVYSYPYYNACKDYGCLDICTGDVIGRSLQSSPPTGGVENVGHVGIGGVKLDRDINYQYHVLEVLDADPVIQENTLEDFQKRATYWGAKFEKPWTPDPPSTDLNLTAEQASLVYETGRAQMAFCPQFVLDPRKTHAVDFLADSKVYSATQGEWVTQLTMRCAAFRSDTFVNYTYEKALGMKLPIPSRYPYPLPVYTYFSLANLRPSHLASIPNYNVIDYSEEIKLNLSDAIKVYKKNANSKTTAKVISAMSQISVDESLSPNARAELFISAIQENKEDIGLIQILTNDFISPKYNLENFIDEIILLFNQSQDTKTKSYLLRGLAVTYSYYLTEKVDKESLKQAKKIQNLFSKQVKLKRSGAFFTSLTYLPIIFSYEETNDIIKTLDAKSLSLAEQHEVVNIIVLTALNYLNSSVSQWDIFWEQYTDEQKHEYARAMSKILTEPGLIALFDKEQKNILYEHLIENWPVSFEEKSGVWVYDMRLWFIALLNLQGDHTQEKKEIMNCLLAKHPNEQERAMYIDQFSFDFAEKKLASCSSITS